MVGTVVTGSGSYLEVHGSDLAFHYVLLIAAVFEITTGFYSVVSLIYTGCPDCFVSFLSLQANVLMRS
jgi:hypothetical protein